MSLVLITGSAGLVGSHAARHFHELGYDVWGIDNDMRGTLLGDGGSTATMRYRLERDLGRYVHHSVDIRDAAALDGVVRAAGRGLGLVIHTAAQPSHHWAATDPQVDFGINAGGTLNLLEATRRHAPDATFIFTSTNKVYGDTPNRLPLVEYDTRYDLPADHPWYGGVGEDMSLDRSTHSLYGVSKAAADLLVQEYGRYFGMATVCFRGGCLSGPGHSGTPAHGFLAYLMKCVATGTPYTIYGYRGKQVRDNIHAADLVAAFEQVARAPRSAAVYNIGGGRDSNCSLREAISMCERITGRELDWSYDDTPRVGDHLWWITDRTTFETDYPQWRIRYDVPRILEEIYAYHADRRR